jgi:nitrite reductase (NADH) small subunit/3-phenylpropionate/trans-cinnamate dioxygenase ferredoxin subunit
MGKLYENKRKPKREGKKVTVGKISDVPAGRGATVKLKDGAEVALFNVDGKFHAIENFCPHKAYPLADSRLDGNFVECDLHGWRFDVRSGACLTKKNCSIEHYEVLIEDEMIKILV